MERKATLFCLLEVGADDVDDIVGGFLGGFGIAGHVVADNYAADTRGFTFAAMAEYHDRRWAVRFAEALMPKLANGIQLDAEITRAKTFLRATTQCMRGAGSIHRSACNTSTTPDITGTAGQ